MMMERALQSNNHFPFPFQVGGNLDELLQDIESMADEVAHVDLSGGADEGMPTDRTDYCPNAHILPNSPNPDHHHHPLHKTFRSELNLVLIAPVDVRYKRLVPVSPRLEYGGCSSDLTPPPNLPEPMSLLPATLPYLDFKSNTAIITTPKAAMANRSAAAATAAENGGGPGVAMATTTVTPAVSKPISSATAVRKKLFGKRNKEPVINEPEHDRKAAVVPLKITIPSPTMTSADATATICGDNDKVNGQVLQHKVS